MAMTTMDGTRDQGRNKYLEELADAIMGLSPFFQSALIPTGYTGV